MLTWNMLDVWTSKSSSEKAAADVYFPRFETIDKQTKHTVGFNI
jgi:hypothetical protein